MRDMESNPSTRTDFETLVKQMSSATAPVTAAQGTSTTGGTSSFSETLSRTMERMQESEQQAGEAQSTEGLAESETDAFLAEMLKQLDAAGGGDGAGGEMGMAKLLEGMMEQLMSKEILYEPMKDLNEKVSPEWMEMAGKGFGGV
jgi:peroxin-19